jgi:hypothetical protein
MNAIKMTWCSEFKRQWLYSRFCVAILLIGIWFTLWSPVPSVMAFHDPFDDAMALKGSYAVTTAEYKFPAEVNPDVLSNRPTELWARVYRPSDLSDGPFPVVAFLHGNHGTCGTGENPRVDDKIEYTYTGSCPPGYVVTPNHAGYDYLAEPLASWGYIVVSINANRGINGAMGVPGDSGLNLARGRLILKHLQRWYEWNTTGGAPASLGVESDGFVGKVDIAHVGIMGHSRGGEGARAAYQQYRDTGSAWQTLIPGLAVTAIFEIGPVDGQTSRVLNAEGVAWNVLLPMCDGDVSNLQGVRPFDRMLRSVTETPMTPKSTYTVWGTNHNFYNTEWQVSDAKMCLRHTPIFDPKLIGSEPQRQTALDSLIPFFLSSVGPFPQNDLNTIFNPLFPLPAEITAITPIDRGFTISPNQNLTTTIENFSGSTGTNTYGFPNEAINIEIVHHHVPDHDPSQRAGKISWISNKGAYFQANWTSAGTGKDISSDYRTLDMRLSRQDIEAPASEATNFSVQLTRADGGFSDPVQVQDYTELRGPVGGPGGLHPILQTARIPLDDFHTPLTAIHGVRLTFDRSLRGAIYVADIQLSKKDMATVSAATQSPAAKKYAVTDDSDMNDLVVIELHSTTPFPVRNAMPILRIGNQILSMGGPKDADLHTMVFYLTHAQLNALSEGATVVLQYDADGDNGSRWYFGAFNRQHLRMEAWHGADSIHEGQ